MSQISQSGGLATPGEILARGPRQKLEHYLATARRRLLAIGIGGAAGWGAALGLAILIASAWIDLALDLSGVLRAVLAIASMLVAIAFAITIFMRHRHATQTAVLARNIDTAAGASGQIVAGIDLSLFPPGDVSPLTTGLAHMASRSAVDRAVSVPMFLIAPAQPLVRPAVVLTVLAALLGVVAIASPRLLHTQWLRMTDPLGDHPAYSPLQFSVDPAGARVIYGSALDIHTAVTGGITDHVDLVYRVPGMEDQIVPMFPQEQGQWRATLADVEQPGQYFLQTGRAQSARFDLQVITVPRIEKVTFRVTLPAYTHRAPYDGPMPQNGIAGLPGTHVVVRIDSNRPLSGGTLTLALNAAAPATMPSSQPSSLAIALKPSGEAANEVTGAFDIARSGKFQILIKDTQGQQSTDSFDGDITLLSDQKPFVRLLEPREASFATPDANIKITALAEDDYGLSQLEIYRSLNDSRPRSMQIAVPPAQPPQLNGVMNLPLADYGLSPGDVVTLFARTMDNDPAGAKGSESTVASIHIISQADMDKMQMKRNAMEVLQSKYAQVGRRLETLRTQLKALQDELSKSAPGKPLTPEQEKKLKELQERIAVAQKEVDRVAAHDLPIDLDQALKKQLADLSKAMKQAGDHVGAAQKAPDINAALDQLAQAAKALGEQNDQFQKQVAEPLDYLARVYPLIEDEQKFVDLYNRQKDLADRLVSLRNINGDDNPEAKARMRDLQDEQNHLRSELRDLLDDIDSRMAALPPDPKLDNLRKSAQDFSKAVRDSAADSQMQDAESALQQFAGSRAADSAAAAARTLYALIAKAQSSGGQAQQALQFQPKLAQGLGDTVDQLLGPQGLSPAQLGSGGKGGYSAARNSLQNVGLYGSLPLISPRGGADGTDDDSAAGAVAGGAAGHRQNPDAAQSTTAHRTAGDSQTPVPPQYQKRVGEYFQRVDDELSE